MPPLILGHSCAGQLCLGWVNEDQLLQLLTADHLHQQLVQPQAQLLLLYPQDCQLLSQFEVGDQVSAKLLGITKEVAAVKLRKERAASEDARE